MNAISSLFQDLRVFYLSNNKKYSLANPFFKISNDNNTLTWNNYKVKETFYTYEEYYNWVANELQYSLSIDDKVFVQIYFHQIDSKIIQASLSFLPRPDLLMSYFRFDMDLKDPKDYYHNSFHINFGYRSDDIRFSLQRFPYPSEFLRFILFLLGYSEFTEFKRKRFFNDLNNFGEQFSHCFDFKIA